MSTVQVTITGGQSCAVPWFSGMNAQQALEGAFNTINNSGAFTFAIQYYGTNLGYLVTMIDNLYESPSSSDKPYYYWEFFLNNVPASTGIDGVSLQQNDTVTFTYEAFSSGKHKNTTVGAKHSFKTRTNPQG